MLEICIDCVASATSAALAGADRVELCANLPEGGTTPSIGMIRAVRRVFSGGLMVLIRPRGYDFLYSEEEMDVMVDDIRAAREAGADGVVIGCLTADGRVDLQRCARLVTAAGSMDLTFHRAFDMARDLPEALEDVIKLGIRRVLSSGAAADATAGSEMLAHLVRQAAGRASIMPGGGITAENIATILRNTGATEAHLSARHTVRSAMIHRNPDCSMGTFSKTNEYEWKEACTETIRIAKSHMIAANSTPR